MRDFTRFIRSARALAVAAATVAMAWGLGPAAAQDPFYEGQTVELIVPHGAGGGFDTYARASARYLEEYLGATVVVKNVTGAGGNIGRNQLYRA